MPIARKVSVTALYTALVTVATLAFTIYVPATRGYFNVGESAVYLAALLGGARVGAFAGGVGSMLADILLGYYMFAPATLVIKGLEGGILGILAARQPKLSAVKWRILSAIASLAVFGLVLAIGTTFYSGTSEVTVGLPWVGSLSFTVELSILFWAAVAAAVGLVVAYASLSASPESGYLALSSMLSGSVMVLGYFLYEQLVLGYVAIAEVPFNIGQVIVGVSIAVPAYASLRAASRPGNKGP